MTKKGLKPAPVGVTGKNGRKYTYLVNWPTRWLKRKKNGKLIIVSILAVLVFLSVYGEGMMIALKGLV